MKDLKSCYSSQELQGLVWGIVDPAIWILVEDVKDGHEQTFAKFAVAVLSEVNGLADWMICMCFIYESSMFYLKIRVKWRWDYIVLDCADDPAF